MIGRSSLILWKHTALVVVVVACIVPIHVNRAAAGYILSPVLVSEPRPRFRSVSLQAAVDLQSDTSQSGRGGMHLSAVLNEGDVVAYQTGTWLVDCVEVGSGNSPSVAYCSIETIQVVWTHNCEHGVLRGMELVRVNNNDNYSNVLKATGKMIEFGPEQLLARIPVEWIEKDESRTSLEALLEDDWIRTGE
jgi:hypothetical protein